MLTRYLERQEWQKLDVVLDLPITVWRHPDFPDVTLRVPHDESLSDYKSAVAQVVKVLANAEKRTEIEEDDVHRLGSERRRVVAEPQVFHPAAAFLFC